MRGMIQGFGIASPIAGRDFLRVPQRARLSCCVALKGRRSAIGSVLGGEVLNSRRLVIASSWLCLNIGFEYTSNPCSSGVNVVGSRYFPPRWVRDLVGFGIMQIGEVLVSHAGFAPAEKTLGQLPFREWLNSICICPRVVTYCC
jgi:hypothetical protein